MHAVARQKGALPTQSRNKMSMKERYKEDSKTYLAARAAGLSRYRLIAPQVARQRDVVAPEGSHGGRDHEASCSRCRV